jgi:hypothetical protein
MLLNKKPEESKGRLLAKLVWALLKEEPFESLADLTDALKFRCARLKIAWTNDDINDAYTLIESNTPLPLKHRPPRRREERPPEPPVIDKAFAAQFFAELGYQIRQVPAATWRDPEREAADFEAARQRALEMGIDLTIDVEHQR